MSVRTTCWFLLLMGLVSCSRPQPRISNYDEGKVSHGAAYRWVGENELEPGWEPTFSTLRKVDSIELTGEAAREMVFELNRGEHYLQRWEEGNDNFVLCHIPRFTLTFYDTLGRQSNHFSFCDECGNVYVTNYAEYPKFDVFMLSKEGMEDIFALRDEMLPVDE